MINRELIVVPPEGEKSDKYHRSNVSASHQDNLIRYIMENNINIDIYDDPFIYTLGLEMAYLNYIVIGIDDKEFYIYLPADITRTQAEWFYECKLDISQFDVFIISVDKDDDEKCRINHIEKDDTGISPVNKLYKELKNKTVKQEEVKVKKYGNK